jgi:hypothetical protein
MSIYNLFYEISRIQLLLYEIVPKEKMEKLKDLSVYSSLPNTILFMMKQKPINYYLLSKEYLPQTNS